MEKLVSEKRLTMVSTDLTGDSEKVNRLQESFDFITENFEQLRNPMLASFLFDASKATPTDEKKLRKELSILKPINLISILMNGR